MPRRAKGARLWLRPERRAADGRLLERAVWIIRDGESRHSTGCGAHERERAERALADYITAKHDPAAGRDRRPYQVLIADAIALYARDVAPRHARPHETAARLERLLAHFGDRTLDKINGTACRAYVRARGADAAARRELEDLRAALRHAWKEGIVDTLVPVTLPERAPGRERWLDRGEVARLIWAAWRLRQRYKGEATARPVARHVARFILVAIYTGTRAGAICSAAIRPTVGRGYVDLDRGVFYRRPPGSRETKKRQPPVALPNRLLVHLRRWERLGISKRAVVEWNGAPVGRINKAFRAAREAAGFGPDVVPHTLRHSAATWLAMQGVPFAEAADYLGMSVQTYEARYRHHAPDHQEHARAAITARPVSARTGRYGRTSREPKAGGE